MREIPLTQGKIAVVDNADYARVAAFKWHFNTGRAVRRDGDGSILMHRFILNPPSWMCVDHINNDKLDNRRANLRLASHSQNSMNAASRRRTAGFKGTNAESPCSWSVRIRGKYVRGRFHTAEEAAIAYDAAALRLFGDFACINGILPAHRAAAKRCLLTDAQAAAARAQLPAEFKFTEAA